MEGDKHLLDAPSVTHDAICNRLISALVAGGGKGFNLQV